MKIKKIKFENHAILGNLELDFTDETGEAVDTVILAGENGCGKTAFLESIYEMLSSKTTNALNLSVAFETSEQIKKATKENPFALLHYRGSQSDDSIKVNLDEFTFTKGSFFVNDEKSQTLAVNPHFHQIIFTELNAIFSTVEINFNSQQVSSVTSMNIDNKNVSSEKSAENLAGQITQLLIDVQALDNEDFAQSARKNQQPDFLKLDSRMNRFKNAFSSIFPQKKLLGTYSDSIVKSIIFEEYGKEMSLQQLDLMLNKTVLVAHL